MAENREVGIYNGHPSLSYQDNLLVRFFHILDDWEAFRIPSGALSIALLTDDALAGIHRSFLDDPSPTDVITFPGTDEAEAEPEAGEICISVDTAVRAAAEHGHSLDHEISLYLVHGWLHLAGLGDKTQEERQEMRASEQKTLQYLNRRKAVPVFQLSE